MFRRIFGPSPVLYTVKKLHSCLFFKGGETEDLYLSDQEFFEVIYDEDLKPRRLTNRELTEMLSAKVKKLTKDQRLLKSVIEEAQLSRVISETNFKNVEEIYQLRRRYKNYLRIKRLIPLSVIGPFTGNELTKMAYDAALGSKSVTLTLPSLIGYSLPTFFFFHMSYFYGPDRLKPFCQVCKYTLGAPFWIASSITDEIMSDPEEKFFGEVVPVDVTNTGGSIPGDIGDIKNLRKFLDDMKAFSEDLTKKLINQFYCIIQEIDYLSLNLQ